jgi:hypothetical protein
MHKSLFGALAVIPLSLRRQKALRDCFPLLFLQHAQKVLSCFVELPPAILP